MSIVFMVAEKPILAESIAKILSGGKFSKRKGWNGVCTICEFNGMFMGKRVRFKMTSTCGHVLGIDFLPQFKNWERTDPIKLFSVTTEKIEANPKMKMWDFLASEAKNSEYLVLWLDCDKEGENICFEVIGAVEGSMRQPPSGNIMNNVYRAHFSATTDKEIKGAMEKLGRPNLNESLSVEARQELDLRIGCAFTRFQTRYFQGKYGDLDSACISFGPCQTPTLGFCVARHDEIVQFKSEPYWIIEAVFEVTDSLTVKPEYARGRIFDRDVCQLLLDRIKNAGCGTVVDVSSKETVKETPLPLNTVELLRVASSAFGLSPATTMSIAENLYTRGFISYPRTETTKYPATFNLVEVLRLQQNSSELGEIVGQLISNGVRRSKRGQDVGDHPPITPMRADNGSLSGDSKRIYDYITQHFIASLMEPCLVQTTTAKIAIGEEHFSLTAKVVLDPGYTKVMTWQAVAEDFTSLQLKPGQKLPLKSANILERATSPPDYLTESELISLMEKHGIGTDASIPVHINTISQRNYVTVQKSRRLIPTKLGVALVHGYRKIDPELVSPTMRAEVETQLDLIAKGRADYSAVRTHVLENFKAKFIYFVENILAVDLLFEDSFTTLADSGKPFCRCGKCRRFMKLVASKPQRLHCPHCQDTYSLPTAKDGVVKLHAEKKCPLDDFDLVYWQVPGGKQSNSFALCPYCYNNPPFEDMKKCSGCNLCTHSTCPNSYKTLGVVQCPKDHGNKCGILVLDPQSHPKWRLSCNYCGSVVIVFEGAGKVKVETKQCEGCGAQLLSALYKTGSPLPNGEASYVGCIFCDESISNLVNLNNFYASDDQVQRSKPHGFSGQRRGGRRGRGGGRRRR